MDNHADNSFRSFITRRNTASIGHHQRAGSGFMPKHYHSNWSSPGLSAELLILILQLVKLLLSQLISQQNPKEYRSIDGSGNNKQNQNWGAANQLLERKIAPDASREPGGATEANLPSAREVSNAVSAQQGNTANSKGLSDMFWLWGQFLDHDITLVEGHGNDKANIAVPQGDPQFDPQGTGTVELSFTRSDSVVDALGQKRHANQITAFIDGSNVYGSDQATANALRSFEGGKLRVDADNLLPKDADGQFQAGDVRANENPGLTSMHTLWVREHNRIADQLGARHPEWSDEKIYQDSREQVVAQLQAITYNEFLPHLLGEDALPAYSGYDSGQNPQMSQAFSSAAYRFGHTMLSSNLLRLDESGQEIPQGNLSLREAFFQPQRVNEAGIDPILRGFASQTAQAVDPMVVDDVRNFLFGAPGAGGLDLAALNIQRGRDHGLPGYNDAREQLGLSRINSFDDPIWKEGVGAKLAQIYSSPDEVDLWVAGLAERPAGDALLGETNTRILTEQFSALRDGDRFWYENKYSGNDLHQLNQLKLSDIIKRNSDVMNIQSDVMVASNIHLNAPVVKRQSAPVALQGNAGAANTIQQNTPDAGALRELQQAVQSGQLG